MILMFFIFKVGCLKHRFEMAHLPTLLGKRHVRNIQRPVNDSAAKVKIIFSNIHRTHMYGLDVLCKCMGI